MDNQEEVVRPLGVIGCLTAGFELVSQQLWLVILPVLLDLLLWAGPRVSIEPLLREFAGMMDMQTAIDPALSSQVQVLNEMIVQLGQEFNLLSLLGGIPVLTVPSLLAVHPVAGGWPLSDAAFLSVDGILALAGWWILLVPIGLVLGFLYLYSVAGQVRNRDRGEDVDEALNEGMVITGEAEPGAVGASRPLAATFWGKLLWYMTFAGGLLLVQVIGLPIGMFVVSMIMTAMPVVGVVIWVFGIGFALYMLLQLVFVIHGVLLGERNLLRAVWESFLLVRSQFWPVMMMIFLVLIVYQGLGRLWAIPEGSSWILLIGILAKACVATGLAAATFIFYRERIPFLVQPWWITRRTKTE